MKAYGIPRNDDVANPDIADIQNYALASHIGRFREKGGDYRSYTRSSKKRKSTRRFWKKRERRLSKKSVMKDFIEFL